MLGIPYDCGCTVAGITECSCSSGLGSGIISLRGYVSKGDTGQRVLNLTLQLSRYADVLDAAYTPHAQTLR